MAECVFCSHVRVYDPLLGQVVVQLLSRVRLFATPWTAARQVSPRSLSTEFAQIHVHGVGDAIQPSRPCRPLLCLPSIFPSIRVFSSELAVHIRWPKGLELQLQHQSFQ